MFSFSAYRINSVYAGMITDHFIVCSIKASFFFHEIEIILNQAVFSQINNKQIDVRRNFVIKVLN